MEPHAKKVAKELKKDKKSKCDKHYFTHEFRGYWRCIHCDEVKYLG